MKLLDEEVWEGAEVEVEVEADVGAEAGAEEAEGGDMVNHSEFKFSGRCIAGITDVADNSECAGKVRRGRGGLGNAEFEKFLNLFV